MRVPTITQFNAWSDHDKLFWINYETDGLYKKMKREEGYFPVIVYQQQDVGIVYKVDNKGELIEAVAMSFKEAMDRLQTFHEASKAMSSTN